MRTAINYNRRRNVQATGGAFCYLFGVIALVTACLVDVALWFAGVQLHPWVNAIDILLFLIGISLIVFAGVCLDCSERGRQSEKD